MRGGWLFVGVALALSVDGVRWRAAYAGEPARIVEQQGRWETAYGDVYYRVLGTVQNRSKVPLKYVKLEMELLDKDGNVVLRRSGYNQKAETLEAVEGYETAGGTASPEEKLEKIEPIAPGEKDGFRMGVGKGEIPKKPRFVSYRVRIVDKLDINTATESDLMKLPEMTEARAKAIIRYRETSGELIQLEELELIPQVKPIFKRIKDELVLE